MKRFIYILILFILHACTQELHLDEGQVANSIVLNISNSSLETKASVPGTSNENRIETLDCFFYTSDAIESTAAVYHAHFTPDVTKQAKVYLYLTQTEFNTIFKNSTACKVYVIANLTLPEGKTNASIADLKALEIESAEFESVISDPDTHELNPPQKFVMHGSGNVTVTNNSASGSVELVRSASKVTLNLKVPEYIEVDVVSDEGTVLRVERWEPKVQNITDPVEMQVSFHNGVKNGRLDSDATIEKDYFETYKATSFTLKETIVEGDEKIYHFTCDAIFYSYPSVWAQGDVNAPYFNLVVPWERIKTTVVGSGNDSKPETKSEEITGLHPYYYQVQINPVNRKFVSNHWYDLTLNIGVLGSTIQAKPEIINDCSYYVMDWTSIDTEFENDYEEINLSQWTYLIVDEHRIEMNNTSTAVLSFDASHSLGIQVEWPTDPAIIEDFDDMEKMYNNQNNKKYHSYYINCSDINAQAESLSDCISNSSFAVDYDKKEIKFTCPVQQLKTKKVYSPVYVHLKVWLNINGDNANSPNTADEEKFVEHITFVYYPSIYITPDSSTLRSIYVNGEKHTNSTQTSDITNTANHTWISDKYNMGSASGVRNHSSNNGTTNDKINYSMYVFTVTSFDSSNNTFKGPNYNAQGTVTSYDKDYTYIIGDPRQRTPDNELDFDNSFNVKDYWAYGTTTGDRGGHTVYNIQTDSSGEFIRNSDGTLQYEQRTQSPGLRYYYPTDPSQETLQVIAPKFRIVSFNNASTGHTDEHSAAMRCASLQEDGFPAGRWRLPTVAEVQFIINLQIEDAIEEIFTSGSSKYATASYGNANKTSRITLAVQEQNNGTYTFNWNNVNSGISVRCVYDDWYWGSEREAMVNPNYASDPESAKDYADGYMFTWGDKEIKW